MRVLELNAAVYDRFHSRLRLHWDNAILWRFRVGSAHTKQVFDFYGRR
jgi:hypothetical protein